MSIYKFGTVVSSWKVEPIFITESPFLHISILGLEAVQSDMNLTMIPPFFLVSVHYNCSIESLMF